MRRFFHRLPLPGLCLRRVCCRPGGRSPPRPFPAKTEAIMIESHWSGFDEELPPNQEARTVTPPAQTTQPPPETAPGPSLLPTPTQPSSDPTLTMLMQMMSSFQSEMKSLRSDLSGSVSSMVAEAVAAHLPQVFLILLFRRF